MRPKQQLGNLVATELLPAPKPMQLAGALFGDQFVQSLAGQLAPLVAALLKEHLNMPKVTQRYMSLEDAATYLGTTKDGVRGMARAKVFPIHKVGARTYIDREEIDRAMRDNTQWAS